MDCRWVFLKFSVKIFSFQWAHMTALTFQGPRYSGCHATIYVRKGAVHDGSIRVMLIQSWNGERGGWEMVQHQRRKKPQRPWKQNDAPRPYIAIWGPTSSAGEQVGRTIIFVYLCNPSLSYACRVLGFLCRVCWHLVNSDPVHNRRNAYVRGKRPSDARVLLWWRVCVLARVSDSKFQILA